MNSQYKPIILALLISILGYLASPAIAQTDSLAFLDYFPMHIGDRWQYDRVEYRNGELFSEGYAISSIVGDSLAANGKRYFIFSPTQYSLAPLLRIDTLQQRLYSYAPYIYYCFTDSERLVLDFSLLDSTMESCDDCYELCELCERNSRDLGDLGNSLSSISCRRPESGFEIAAPVGLVFHGIDDPLGNAINYSLIAANINGVTYGQFLDVSEKEDASTPSDFQLHPGFPNPFNPATTISYDIPKATQVNLTLYDIAGREVATLVNEYMTSGRHQIQWNAGNLSSGIYIARLSTQDFTKSIKLALLK